MSKQIHANPKVEICAFKDGEWLRVAGELVEDDRREARQSMLDAYPSLQQMYSADDGITKVFYIKNATATFSSFTKAPEVVTFYLFVFDQSFLSLRAIRASFSFLLILLICHSRLIASCLSEYSS